MSGSTPQWSMARKCPVRPSPVWISSTTNKVLQPLVEVAQVGERLEMRGTQLHGLPIASDRIVEATRRAVADARDEMRARVSRVRLQDRHRARRRLVDAPGPH